MSPLRFRVSVCGGASASGRLGGVPAHPVAVTEIPVAVIGNPVAVTEIPVALPVHAAALLMLFCALGCECDRLTIVQAWLRQIFASELNKLKPAKTYLIILTCIFLSAVIFLQCFSTKN